MAGGNTARSRTPSPPRDAAARLRQVSPRTLHERLGLDQPHASTGSTTPSDSTLLHRVQGAAPLKQSRGDVPSAAMGTTGPLVVFSKKVNEVVTSVGQGRPLSANSAPSTLEAWTAHDKLSQWPAGGQKSNWKAAEASISASTVQTSTGVSQSKRLDRNANGHPEPPEPGRYQAANGSQVEVQGPIRVSEDGEVWRSPPPRPTASGRTSSFGAAVSTASKPIDLTIPAMPATQITRPDFSPLPPFARSESGGTTSESSGLFKGVPPRGFRRLPQVGRAASRPPQIGESSYTRPPSFENRPPMPRSRASQPHPADRPPYRDRDYDESDYRPTYNDEGARYLRDSYRPDYRSDTHLREPALSRRSPSPERSRGDTPPARIESFPTTSNRGQDTRSSWDHRSSPTLASPAGKDSSGPLIGEEIPTRPHQSHGNKSSVRPSSLSRLMETARSDAASTTAPVPTSDRNKQIPTGPAALQDRPAKQERLSSPSNSSSTETDAFRRPGVRPAAEYPATSSVAPPAVKREPRSPSHPTSVALPPATGNNGRPLFNSLTHSPEERKPVIRKGFTPPLRPTFVTPAQAPSTHIQHLQPNEQSRPTTSKSTLEIRTARDVAQAHVDQVNNMQKACQAGGFNDHSGSTSLASAASAGHNASKPANEVPPTSPAALRRSETAGFPAVMKREPDDILGEADMEIDELEASSSPAPPVAGPSRERMVVESAQRVSPDVHASLQSSTSMRTSPLPAVPSEVAPARAASSKGKERAIDAPFTSNSMSKEVKKARSSDVISIGSDDDEPELVVPQTSARPAAPWATSGTVNNGIPRAINAEVASRVSLQSPSIPPQRPPGEERTRVFPLPAKIVTALQLANKRRPAALRNYLDEKYEELELELQSPLRRIDDIPKDDTIRLVYVELELASNEVAVLLPRDCLKSQTSSSEDREERQRSFAVQQVVQFAKEGREPETTRFTPAYIIVVFKKDQQPPAGANTDRQPVASVTAPRSAVPRPVSAGTVGERASEAKVDPIIKTKKDKKRKRVEVGNNIDDAASVTSIDSATSKSKKKDKQARKSLDTVTAPASSVQAPSEVTSKGTDAPRPKPKPVAQPAKSIPEQGVGAASTAPRMVLGKPRVDSILHTMHGSLSHGLKDSREKPRVFFPSQAFNNGYIAVSMRGHLHYWHKSMATAVLSSEDKQTHASLGMQTALWSDEQKLAVLGYVSTSAAAVAGMQLVKFNTAEVIKSCALIEHDQRLTVINIYADYQTYTSHCDPGSAAR